MNLLNIIPNIWPVISLIKISMLPNNNQNHDAKLKDENIKNTESTKFTSKGLQNTATELGARHLRLSTYLMLAIFASGMFAFGTHEVEEFIVKGDHLEWIGLQDEKQITRAWDILKPTSELQEGANSNFYSYNINNKNIYTHILHDKGRVGVFLKGFVGYNSNPNWAEVFIWLLSLFFGIRMWRKFYFKKNKIFIEKKILLKN